MANNNFWGNNTIPIKKEENFWGSDTLPADNIQQKPKSFLSNIVESSPLLKQGVEDINANIQAAQQNPVIQEANEQAKIKAIQQLSDRYEWEQNHPFISEMQRAFQPGYVTANEIRKKKAQYGNYIPAEEMIDTVSRFGSQNVRPTANIGLTATSLGLGNAGIKAFGATKFGGQALKAHPYITPAVVGAVSTAPENAAFGVADKGLAELQGAPTEESYGEAARNAALFGGAIHGGIGALRGLGHLLGKVPVVKDIPTNYNNLVNSDTPLGNGLAKVQGAIEQALNLKSNNEKVGKYREFSNKMSRYNAPLQNKATREQLENLHKAENLDKKEARQMRRHLWSGEYTKDPFVEAAEKDGKTAKEVVEDFNAKRQENLAKKQVDEDRNISPEEWEYRKQQEQSNKDYEDLKSFYDEATTNWKEGKISNEQMKEVSEYYNKEASKYQKLNTEATEPINDVKTSSDVITPKEDLPIVNEPASDLKINKLEGKHKHDSRIKVMNQKQPTISSQPKTLEGGLEYNEPVVREDRTSISKDGNTMRYEGRDYKYEKLPTNEKSTGDLERTTTGEENVYKDVEKEPTSSFDADIVAEANKKYKVLADGKTIVYRSGKKAGKPVDRKEIAELKKRLEATEKEPEMIVPDKYDNDLGEVIDTDATRQLGTEDPNVQEFVKKVANDGPIKRKVHIRQQLEKLTPEERKTFLEELSKHQEYTESVSRAKKPGDLERKTTRIYDEAVDIISKEKMEVKNAPKAKYEETSLNKNELYMKEQTLKDITKNKKSYIKGRMNALWNKPEEAQSFYDDMIDKVKKSKTSNRVKADIIKDINKIADDYITNNKHQIKKVDYNAKKLETESVQELEKANKMENSGLGAKVIKDSNLKYKYTSKEGKAALKEHYIQSTENAVEKLESMGYKEVAPGKVEFSRKQAIQYAKDKVKQSDMLPAKKKAELEMLDRRPDIALARTQREANKLLKANKNILEQDVKNAGPRNMKSLKPIEGAKGTDKRYQYEDTGDSFHSEVGNESLSNAKAKERTSAFDKAINEKSKMIDESNAKANEKYNRDLKQNDKETNKTIEMSKKMRENANDIKSGETVVKENESINRYFDDKQKSNLKDVEVVYYDGEGKLNGKSSGGYNEIFINTKDRTNSQINFTTKHEMQHMLDYKESRTLSKEVQKMYDRIESATSNAANFIKDNFGKFSEVIIKKKDLHNKIKEILSNKEISFEELEKFKNLIDKRKTLTKEEKDLVNNTLEAVGFYRNSVLERRANNAGLDIKNNGDLEDDIRKCFNEFRGRKGKTRGLDNNRPGSDDKGIDRKTRLDNSTVHDMYELDPKIPEVSQDVKDVTKYYEDLSRHQQAIKEKLGIITEEQAKGKLKKQGSEKGVYVKPVFKGTNTIDIKRDYNQSRDTKEDLFGKVKRDGIRSAKANDYLKAMIEEDNKASHINDVMNYVEREFSKEIPENGVIPKGYKAVNKFILSNAMWGEFTPAWYETMVQGKKSIESVFKNPGVAKAWTDKFEKFNKNDYMIPEAVFNELFTGRGETVNQYWQRYGTTHFGKALLKTSGAILDVMNNSFKRGVLTSGSFFTNNRFGNAIMIAAKEGPVNYLRSYYDGLRLKTSDLPSELAESSIMEAYDQVGKRASYTGWQPLDNFFNLINGVTFETKNLKGADKLKAKAANAVIGLPNKWFNYVSDKLMKFNQAFENFERRQAYSIQLHKIKPEVLKTTGRKMIAQEELLKHIKKHPELEEVLIKNIEDTLGDYNNFSKFEKATLKKLIPFYSWYRTITRHTISLMKENPSRAAMIWLELVRMEDRDKDTMKEYQRGAYKTGIKDSRSGKEIIVNKVAQIPYNTFKEMYQDSRGAFFPSGRVASEAIRGAKYFNNSEITSRRYVREKKGYGKDAKYVYLDTKTGERLDKLPLSVRAKYVGKEIGLKTMYPFLSSPLIKPESLAQGGLRALQGKEFLEPDKIYDSDLGGYYTGDKIPYSKKSRYAANNLSQKNKWLNRLFGGIQNKADLNSFEKSEIRKEKIKEYNKKHKKKRGM